MHVNKQDHSSVGNDAITRKPPTQEIIMHVTKDVIQQLVVETVASQENEPVA